MNSFSFNKTIQSLLNGIINMVPTKSVVSAIVGGIMSMSASKQAQKGVQAGLDVTQARYEEGRRDLEPYRAGGEWGLEKYLSGVNRGYQTQWGGFSDQDMYRDPGYQFRRDQGLQALDRMYSKGGQRMSGSRGMGLQDYAQQAASQEFGAARGRSIQDYSMRRQEETERFSQFANLAQMGQQAAGRTSSLGQQYGSSMANLYGQQGQYQAAGTMGVASNIQGGLAAYQYQQNFDRMSQQPQSYYNQPPPTSAVEAGDAYAPAYGG